MGHDWFSPVHLQLFYCAAHKSMQLRFLVIFHPGQCQGGALKTGNDYFLSDLQSYFSVFNTNENVLLNQVTAPSRLM
jgi:hypothetical protein